MKTTFSIIIPVYNEAVAVHRVLSNVHRLRWKGPVEIIVVDGHPEKTTIGSICDPKVKTLAAGTGRAVQMNCGAAAAKGEILLFLHADTQLYPDALQLISETIQHGHIVGGAFDLGIRSGKTAFRLIETMVFYRTRITKIPYGDQAMFFKRVFFWKIGGYKEIPVMEDVELMRRVKKGGHQIEVIPVKVRTSARRWEKEGIVPCTLRNWTLVSLYLMGVSADRLVKYYR